MNLLINKRGIGGVKRTLPPRRSQLAETRRDDGIRGNQ